MAKLRRTEAGDFIKEGSPYVTAHNQNGHVTSHEIPEAPLTLEQRIYVAVWTSGGAMTRREIAKAVGLKSTGWLNGKIDGMVKDGFMCRNHGTHTNGWIKYEYEVIR